MNTFTPPKGLKEKASELRRFLRASPIFSKLYYGLNIDNLEVVLGHTFKRQALEACEKFLSPDEYANKALVKRLIKDMVSCYFQIKARPDEYFLMGLRNLSPKDRAEFLTDKFEFMTLGKIIPRKQHDLEIENKMHFYKMAKKYFKREAVEVSSSSDYKNFEKMVLNVHNVILKPNAAALGAGIEARIIKTSEEAKTAFEMMIDAGGVWIVEERVQQCAEMAAWNESSCNTVRFLSFLNKNGFFAITPFFRTGRKGNVVDNAGAGGVFANVDVETGIISTDGVDELGRTHKVHPDSKMQFMGWQIPKYTELVETVKEMHYEIMPSHPYIGWDMALTDEGWVVIECNWGQFINQYADHIGRKKEFLKYIYGN